MPKDEVTKAVRDLRVKLEDTQQQFATRMNMAISTVVRYELSRPPRGKVLAQLERMAMEHGFDEEAAVFRRALRQELGITMADVPPRFPAVPPLEWHVQPETEDEKDLVETLLWAIRSPNHSSLVTKVKRVFAGAAREKQEQLREIESALSRMAAILRLVSAGETLERISQKTRLSVELLEQWLPVFRDLMCAGDVPEGEGTTYVKSVVTHAIWGMSEAQLMETHHLSSGQAAEIRSFVKNTMGDRLPIRIPKGRKR
jgi:transcriptional regulator with XRE-family HTH domain